MELEQIKAIVAMMKDNDLSEFSMEQDGLKIRIKRGPDEFQQTVTLPPSVPAQSAAASTPVQAAPPAPAVPATVPPAADIEHITSPMVGTFYLSPSPDAPPYVEVGQEVDPETVVCIVEAMKVMNEIKAEVKGVITGVVAENAKPVEFGQKLFAVRVK
ncbi:MAG TPA: acetyl-CoA carboxylase biotin carboxyl carrier protein [Verrucomicrobiae bacterium]|nr:acetyl-CoA carboxylase biotin carboxyl carrier protein [Verrucomicrobiae bacterium]